MNISIAESPVPLAVIEEPKYKRFPLLYIGFKFEFKLTVDQNQNAKLIYVDQDDVQQQGSATNPEQPNIDKQDELHENTVDQTITDSPTMEVHHPHHLTHKKK